MSSPDASQPPAATAPVAGLWQHLGAWWLRGAPPRPSAAAEPMVEIACGWDAMPVFVLERPAGQPEA